MPLPDADVARIARYCADRVAPELSDQVRVEHETRGATVTIVERRPPWREDLGPEWTSTRVAQLRHDAATATWSLFWSDSSLRWHRYEDAPPMRDVERLLAEIEADPTGIFWG